MIRFSGPFEQEDKYMIYSRLLPSMIVTLAIFAGVVDAQKTTAKKTPTKKPPVTKPTIPPLDVRVGREKVENQLSNVNDYLNKLGPIAQNLETAVADKNAGKLKTETVKKVDQAQQQLIKSIQDLKFGLSALESEFRTKPALQKYLPTLQGMTDLAAKSEDLAIAGKFVGSKEPLRQVAQKLTDTLAAMPAARPN